MATTANALRRELKWLRRDEGRTIVRLQQCDALVAALGNPEGRTLLNRFDAAVAGLGNDLRSLALKNAFAIGLKDPGTLTRRRETFGAQSVVDRGPDTITNWENEKLDELIALLLSDAPVPSIDHLLVAFAVEGGRIKVATEGEAASGKSLRQLFNPNAEMFVPAFIYQVPIYLRPSRLTISALFLDAPPSQVSAEASADLLAFTCGDGKQQLNISLGSYGEVQTAAHATIHYDDPEHTVFYGVAWN